VREPELTIGMPVYNGAATIRAALDSLLAQTFQNFALVISDNNSSDSTEEICREYESRDPRIRYVRQPKNLGPANNFRFVLFEATTPFFMWATADDLWAPNFVERTLNFLVSNPDYVCCQTRVLFTTKQGESYFATGTYALTGTWRENAERFFRNPACNSRYYGLFRTRVLRSVFPTRSFFAYDLAVSAGTIKFGKHAELPECLMIRDASAFAAYERAARNDHWFVLWQLFPLLLMTIYCLRKGYVPKTFAGFDALSRLNLYITFALGLFDFGPIGRRYIQTHSLSYAVLGRYSRLRLSWYNRLRNAWRAQDLQISTPTPPSLSARSQISTPTPPSLPARSKWVSVAPLAGRSPDMTIVLVTKSLESTLAFVDSLAHSQGRLALDLIICDVGKGDVTGVLFANRPNFLYIRCEPDAAYSNAANQSLSSISTNVVGFFEAETLMQGEAPQHLLSSLTDQKGIVGPQVLYPDGRLKAAGGIVKYRKAAYGYGHLDPQPDHPRYKFARQVDFCPAGYLIKRDIIHELAGFNEQYRTFEFAHIDLAFRARALGHSCHYCPSAQVFSYCAEGGEDRQNDWDRFAREKAAQIVDDYETTGQDLSRLHDRAPAGRVLYIDADSPTPDQNAGSAYTINIIRILNEFGFRVTFVPESNFIHRGKYTDTLQAMGVEAIYAPYFHNVRDLLIEKDGNFELVVLCRVEIAHRYLDLVRQLVPRARIVFNTVDLHFLREMRGAELLDQAELLERAQRTRHAEVASIRKADATIVLTDQEADIVRREAPGALIHVIPLVPDPDELCRAAPFAAPFAARSGVIFVGTYQHAPNADAVTYFVRSIWPLFRQRVPTAVFRIVGSGVTPEVQALAGNGVEVVGFVDDLDAVLAQCRVAVVPLRYGAGMKGKILTSLRAGLPTVSSSIGIEGFALTPGEEILVEDDPYVFADAVTRLYTDEAMWTRLSQKELEFARKNFSFDRSRDLFHRLLSDIEVDRLSTSTASKMDAEILRSTSQFQRDIRKAKPVCVTK
jgi:GT2 family glycosyltransferase/glycosyltransferase involved in cell wall biosynthesis